MATFFTNQDIDGLINERKTLPDDYQNQLKLRHKRGHDEREIELTGSNGSRFLLVMRLSQTNILDFSVILAYQVPNTNTSFRLRRYNGKSHEHTNKLEKQIFYGYHIHIATERYQQFGEREDAYAEQTDRFSDLNSAVVCMLDDCGFDRPIDPQLSLW
jgi:hypothetical protein